jgi:hypothetical protein
MTDRFVVTAREVAAIQGLPDYPFVAIDHPIAGNSDDELRAKAERALGAIVAMMTRRKAGEPAGEVPRPVVQKR